jgi:hypothetical protein
MPKRVIDFDALWASDKLASCAEWAQSEYAWLYGLADASGSFEMSNLRVIWGRVAAIRKNLTLERLQEIFDEFVERGLLFTWEENGKRYGHWTGSDVPGRLPAPSWRMRLEKLAPPVPREGLAAYSARFGGSKEGIVRRAEANGIAASQRPAAANAGAETRELNPELEDTQAQDWDLGLDWEKDLEKERETQVCLPPQRTRLFSTARALALERRVLGAPNLPPQQTENLLTPDAPPQPQFEHTAGGDSPRESAALEHMEHKYRAEFMPEALLEIYEEERGELPPAGALTAERRRNCERWPAKGFTLEEFREAVRRAATTPFLMGDNPRGWQASFDWLIARRINMLKVLCGDYDSHRPRRARKSRAERRGPADLYTGMGPRPADCGVRVNPAALERIRARQAACLALPKPTAFDAQPRASPAMPK